MKRRRRVVHAVQLSVFDFSPNLCNGMERGHCLTVGEFGADWCECGQRHPRVTCKTCLKKMKKEARRA